MATDRLDPAQPLMSRWRLKNRGSFISARAPIADGAVWPNVAVKTGAGGTGTSATADAYFGAAAAWMADILDVMITGLAAARDVGAGHHSPEHQ